MTRRAVQGTSVPYPQLYNWYSLEQAISFFGARDDARSFCNGQWLVFPTTVVCLTDIDETNTAGEATKSHFTNAAQFCWVADQSYRGSDGEPPYFVPPEAISGSGEKRLIELFVRPPEAREYLYAGQLARSHMQSLPAREGPASASFRLKPALASRVWIELGGLRPGDTDHASVDLALDRLRHPTTVHDRLSVLERLVNYWHAPIRPEDAMSEAEMAGVSLPLPLRWWYSWAGNRAEVLSRQNWLFVPHDRQDRRGQLTFDHGRLRFYAENQGVYQWSTLPGGEDPPVFGRYEENEPWAEENVTLSEHLILACLFEALMCHAQYRASVAWLDKDQLDPLIECVPPIALGPWRWLGMRFFVRQGAFMCACANGTEHYSAWLGAKTEYPLQFLKPFLNNDWDHTL
jgi:hypothetical protein